LGGKPRLRRGVLTSENPTRRSQKKRLAVAGPRLETVKGSHLTCDQWDRCGDPRRFWGRQAMQTILARKILYAAMAGACCLYTTAAVTQPVIVGDHYEENIRRTNCANNSATICGLPFAIVPTGKKLLVTSVSCSVTYTGAPGFRAFQLAHQVGPLTDLGGLRSLTWYLPSCRLSETPLRGRML
jgi:hypothetical protein